MKEYGVDAHIVIQALKAHSANALGDALHKLAMKEAEVAALRSELEALKADVSRETTASAKPPAKRKSKTAQGTAEG